MTTITRHTLTDGSVPLDTVAEIQMKSMTDEATIAGKTLDNVQVLFTGTVADALANLDAQQHVPALVQHQDVTKLSIVIHSAELVDA